MADVFKVVYHVRQMELIAAFRNLKHFVDEPLVFMRDMHEKHGDFFSLYLGHKKFYFVSHPELAEHILNSNADNYRKSRLIFDKIKPITGNQGLVQLEGDAWQAMRRITGEVFHKKYIDGYVEMINAFTDDLVLHLKEAIQSTNTIDISALMINYAMTIAVRIFFGIDYDEKADLIAKKFIELNKLCGLRMRSIFTLPLSLPTPLNRKIKYTQAELRNCFNELILSAKNNSNLSLLTKLYSSLKNQKKASDVIQDQMMTFIFAGYETSAASFAFCFYLLAKYPLHQQMIREETGVGSSVYVQAAYREALRLYPPAYMLAREVMHDHRLADAWLRKKDNVIVSLYKMHRHQHFWPNADQYMPRRFLPSNHHENHKFAFLPFGYCKRVCSGMQLAMIEATIVIKKLLQHFTFSLPDEDKGLQVKALVTLHPKNQVNLNIDHYE